MRCMRLAAHQFESPLRASYRRERDHQPVACAQIHAAGAIGREARMARMLDPLAWKKFFESVALAPCEACLRRDPQKAIRCFGQRFDRRTGQPITLAEAREARAVVAKKAVLRAHP